MIYLELTWCFLRIALFSIGGGYAAIPLIQAMIVDDKQWITLSQFTDLVSIAEMTPGPIAINSATFVGLQIAGIGGAIAATVGCVIPSLIIVSLLAKIYMKYEKSDFLQNVMQNIRPAVIALILSAGVTMLMQVLNISRALYEIDLKALLLFVASFLLISKAKWNPIIVMICCGALSLLTGLITGGI